MWNALIMQFSILGTTIIMLFLVVCMYEPPQLKDYQKNEQQGIVISLNLFRST